LIPSNEVYVLSSQAQHPGKGGKNYEDRQALSTYQLSERDLTPSLLAVVADGRSSLRAGEVAAQSVVDVVSLAVAQSDASQPSAILHSAIIQAGQSILTQSENESDKRGMGSTCLCAWIVGNRLYTASLGNSRLFHLRQGLLQQMNVIHTLAEGVEKGNKEEDKDPGKVEDAEETKELEETRGYLGSRMRAQADFRLVLRPGGEANAERNQGVRLQANDRLLLCTNGLSKALTEEEITEVLGSAEIDKAAEALVQAALQKNAQDNLSAIVLGMPPAHPTPIARRLRVRPVLLIIIASLLLALTTIGGWFILGQRSDPESTARPSPVSTLTPLPSNTPEQP
jgi:protein phosphatase